MKLPNFLIFIFEIMPLFNNFYIMKAVKTRINEWKPSNYDSFPNIIKLYHGTDVYAMDGIVESGVISARNGIQHGETNGINWFSTDLTGNFGTGTYFSIEVPKSDFDKNIFNFMNSGEVTSRISEIPIDKYNMKIEKLNGVPVSRLIKVYNECEGDVWEMQDRTITWDENGTFQLTNPSYRYIIEQEFGKDATKDYYDFMSMNESVENNNVIYYGVFLDQESKNKLMELVPENAYKVYCDHMTLAHKSTFTEEVIEKCESMLGREFILMATTIGISKDAMAVGIETNCFSVNEHKHITLCTMTPSSKPVQSNYIKEWKPLKQPIALKGVVRGFVGNGLKEQKKNNQYVRQDIMLNVTAGDCGMMDEQQLTEVEANDINLKSFEIQDELNPKFWINNKINSRVRLKLLDLADEFYDSLNIKWVKPKDIVLTGSIANYNWSKYSDVDVHILVDYKEVWKKTDFVKDYFDSKKQLWSEEHDTLKIYGFPVEMYVEDANVKNPNSGIYSLEKNKWLVEPNDFQDAEINEERIKEISAKLMTEIDDIDDKLKTEKDNHKLEVLSTKMKKLFDKLVKQRKESLDKHGEMGTYNIIWKVLRRAGYLDKIWDIINNIYNKVNSIKENTQKNKNLIAEAMKSDFSFEELSSLSTMDAIGYCFDKLGDSIGCGSSRMVFQIDDVQVLKVAGNDKGISQNRVEASTKDMKLPIFPYVFYVDKNYKWIVTEYVLPSEYDDYVHCIGKNYRTLFYDIIPSIKSLKYYNGMSDFDELIKQKGLQEHYDFYRNLARYILDYDIPIGDIQCLQNWGITRRNGKDTLVILDPGWNKETMKLYGCQPSDA